MSDRIDVTATETGVVRVFDVDLTPQEAKAFNQRNGIWPLRDALGAEVLDPGHVDLVQIEDLEGYGLMGYLTDGMGIKPGDIHDHAQVLGALKGTVLIVRSSAFAGQAQSLEVRAPIRLVATFREDVPPVTVEKLPGGGAEGTVPPRKSPPSDAAMSGRIATVALLVIFALTALVVWVAS